MSFRHLGLAAIAFVLVGACGGSNGPPPCGKTTASATDCGGANALIAAARAEGQLNVIALAPEWVNYGAILDAFKAKYPWLRVNSANPNAVSEGEIEAVKAGGGNAPDVVDIQSKVALANASLFAPYRVATWNDIPANLKEGSGLWVSDYGGYMSIGYDPAKVQGVVINSLADLLGPTFKGKVALSGDPTKSDQALNSLLMASVATGGSVADVSKGVDFFHQLKVAGNFTAVAATVATVKSGQTPVVFEWDYLSVAHRKDVSTWTIFEPSNAIIGAYYTQAINKSAPHPAAARLWEEFLFSDAGQNLWLKGGAHPVRQAAMEKSGQIDGFALAALPQVKGTPMVPTPGQQTAAATFLSSRWAQAIA